MANVTNSSTIAVIHEVCRVIDMTTYSMAFLLHAVGLLVTGLYKRRTNQNLILFSLSLTEILVVVIGCISRVDTAFNKFLSVLMDNIIDGVEYALMMQVVFMMLIITVDRLICVINPLLYKLRVTNGRLKFVLITTCIISISIVAVSRLVIQELYIYFLIGIGFAYIVLAIVTYLLVLCSLRKRRKELGAAKNGGNTDSLKKQYLVPGIIVSTFLIFYIIPYVLYHAMWSTPASIMTNEQLIHLYISDSFMLLGLLADPLTYIFLSNHYREMIWNFFKKICLKRNSTAAKRREEQSNSVQFSTTSGTV